MGSSVIVVRRFETSDVEAAAALEAANQPRPWTEGVFRDELEASGRTYLIAEAETLVGFGGLNLVSGEAHVTNLLVAPEHRGRGVGKRLLIELIRSAVDDGARHLTLEVRSENKAARSLYTSVGLAPVGVRPGYYGDDDALIMWAHDIDSPEYLGRLA